MNSTDYSRREQQDTGNKSLIENVYYGESHSAGGHTINDGIRLRSVDPQFNREGTGQISVGAQMTWDRILRRGYMPRSMQAYYNLSVGGSVAVNAHGGWWRCKPVGQTVRALDTEHGRLFQSDQLFWHYVGGYGLSGEIKRVHLEVTKDCRLDERAMLIPSDQLLMSDSECFRWSGHLSNDWRSIYLRVGFRGEESTESWKPPTFWLEAAAFNTPFWLRWALEKGLSEVTDKPTLSSKLAHTAWFEPWFLKRWRYSYLMEFFLPKARATHWMEAVREEGIQPTGMMNTSIRQVAHDPNPILSYAPDQDMFSFVIYGRTGRDETRLQHETIRLVDSVINFGGTYYLPYRPHPTVKQFKTCYPRWSELQLSPDINSRFRQRYFA